VSSWQKLERAPKYEVKTKPRKRPKNVKVRIVNERGYINIRLDFEEVAEFDYKINAPCGDNVGIDVNPAGATAIFKDI